MSFAGQLFVAILLAHLLRGELRPAGAWIGRSVRRLGACFATFAVVYTAGSPGILWELGTIVRFVIGLFALQEFKSFLIPTTIGAFLALILTPVVECAEVVKVRQVAPSDAQRKIRARTKKLFLEIQARP